MRRTGLSLTLAALVAAPIGGNVALADDIDAAELINNDCSGCHSSEVYTRDDRRVHSLAQLGTQVRMCDANLGIGLFDEDVEAVVKFLDQNYYKFSQ